MISNAKEFLNLAKMGHTHPRAHGIVLQNNNTSVASTSYIQCGNGFSFNFYDSGCIEQPPHIQIVSHLTLGKSFSQPNITI
jgi:hypothetical protein